MSRRGLIILLASILSLAATGPVSAADGICLGSGPTFVFHLNTDAFSTTVGDVLTLVGLLRSQVGATAVLDPVTGTAIFEDPGHVRVNLTQAALTGTTIYSARLTLVSGFAGGFFWVSTATVNRLPQGMTLFPQTTVALDIVDCVTGLLRTF